MNTKDFELPYCHLCLLRMVERVFWMSGGRWSEYEVGPATQSQHIVTTKKEASIASSNERAVPVGAILRQVFSIHEGVDFIRLVVFVDDGIDSQMPL